ncbi:MAG: type II/IV secretion system ATPase subunit [Nanoarchaeota archaeon]|nr:type II/IV secretion system ATPase subunit [Nanoarchaeota archaeon]
MALDYTYDDANAKVRINCLGYLYGASLEDFEEAMQRTIDVLLEAKKVESIVLVKEREYEYDYEQTKLLTEIASVIDQVLRERIIADTSIGEGPCKKFFPEWNRKLQYIVLELLRKDPIGAYVELIREMRDVRHKLRHAVTPKYDACYRNYYTKALAPVYRHLSNTKLIMMVKDKLDSYHVGNRDLYRQIFMPSVRPNFMLTKYRIIPPKGTSVDRYTVGDIQIEIFKLADSTEYFYYVLPPEFRLSDKLYTVLDAARHYMATHKPTTPEFVRSKNMRDLFMNIGRDVIRSTTQRLRIHLTGEQVDQLATILTRYTAGLGILEVLLQDQRIQDIYVNSPIERQPVLIFHSEYEECKTNLIPTIEDAEGWATRLRIESGRPLDEANPVLDVNIGVPGGRARFAVITRTLSPSGLGFAIRRHRDKPWTLPLFIKNKMLNPLAAGLLSFLIDGSVSILVAGGRGSGKTSILGALMLELLPKVRIITLEDTLELPVETLRELNYNIERLKSRSVITHVETEMPADEALRTALRLGDSALIVGEVRSVEAKALYEAMRVGALSNIVAGTIHGESAYGVFDRVVNDLGVPATSFKATDILPIAKMLRSADGLHRYRRLTEITEIRKEWNVDPMKEGGFINLMEYSGKEDTLKPTDTLVNGESEVLNRISSYVKEWSGNWEAVWENIKLRGRMKQKMIDLADETKRPELLEADWIVASNNKFHLLSEQIRKEVGVAEPHRIYNEWLAWFKLAAKLQSKAPVTYVPVSIVKPAE